MSLAAVQSTRLDERLRRELGPSVLAALSDPDVIEIILNPDGTLWLESHAEGMRPAGARMPAVQAERLIGTVAFALNTVANDQRPVIECELPLDGSRFTGWLPPIVSSPSFVIRKHARLIYTLDDYLVHTIIDANQAEVFGLVGVDDGVDEVIVEGVDEPGVFSDYERRGTHDRRQPAGEAASVQRQFAFDNWALIVRHGVKRKRHSSNQPLSLNRRHSRPCRPHSFGVRFKPERAVRIEDDLDHIRVAQSG